MYGVLKGQRALALLELELQTGASCHADAGNQTWIPCKSSQCSLLTTEPSLRSSWLSVC
ncbi:rCG54092 [Rattus norvegicus]|uniref:RCG54092 n=1 Tax=Rattus norvegicus TaxID=10116 RepID=A6J9D4_RAT|nr:rCG54092 [Rattus norvegicus]